MRRFRSVGSVQNVRFLPRTKECPVTIRSTRVGTVVAAAALLATAWVTGAPAASATLTGEGMPSAAPAVTCSDGVGDGRRTVLLVHGTGSTAEEAWSWNWERTLPALGYGVCSVDVPDRELASLTDSAEHVADAARYAHQKAGRKISMMGHSQGGTLVVWVAKFFPDVAARTDDVISLAGDFGGTALLAPTCLDGACPAISWQLVVGSRHLEALRNAPFPQGPSFSSIYSTADEIVFPQPAGSTLPGASNVSLQDVCGARPVEHGGILADFVAHSLVRDALAHAGPTRLSRLSSTTRLAACASTTQPGTDPTGVRMFAPTLAALADGTLLGGQPDVAREPDLPAYAEDYAS